jgi:hypothetical protein
MADATSTPALAPEAHASPVVAPPAAVAQPARTGTPASWAKQKSTPEWVLAGAYFEQRWERDGAGNDLSLVTESDFDAACVAVASISISSAPHPRKG